VNPHVRRYDEGGGVASRDQPNQWRVTSQNEHARANKWGSGDKCRGVTPMVFALQNHWNRKSRRERRQSPQNPVKVIARIFASPIGNSR